MHEFFDLSKKCYAMIAIVIVYVIAILKKNRKCVCLTDKYEEFCEEVLF